MKRLWSALALCALASCINFDSSRDDFCQKRPDVCFGDGGISGGGGGGSGENDGGADAGIDGGLDGGVDGGESDGGGIDAGSETWSRGLGGSFCTVLDMKALGQSVSGEVSFAGSYQDECELALPDAGTALSIAQQRIFLSRLDAKGAPSLFLDVPGSGSTLVTGTGVTSNGGLYLTASVPSSTTLTFNPDAGCSMGGSGGWATDWGLCLVKLQPDAGYQWLKMFGMNGNTGSPKGAFANEVVVGADDSLNWGGTLVGGNFFNADNCTKGNADWGGMLVGHVDADGGNCWAIGSGCLASVDDLVTDPSNGDIYLSAKITANGQTSCGFHEFGGTQKQVALSGDTRVLAHYSESGTLIWLKPIPNWPPDTKTQLAFVDGKLYAAAHFNGQILTSSFDGGLTSSNGSWDIAVVRIHSTGVVDVAWQPHVYGGSADEELQDMEGELDGGLWLSGYLRSPEGVSFGGAPLVSPDAGAQLFIAALDGTQSGNLAHRASRIISSSGGSTIDKLRGHGPLPVMMGRVKGSIDLGNGPINEAPPAGASAVTEYLGRVKP